MSSRPGRLVPIFKRCGHQHCLLSIDTCCECSDRRPDAETYPRYIDGVGLRPWGHRTEFYCRNCRELADRQDNEWISSPHDDINVPLHDPADILEEDMAAMNLLEDRVAAWGERQSQAQPPRTEREEFLAATRDLDAATRNLAAANREVDALLRQTFGEETSTTTPTMPRTSAMPRMPTISATPTMPPTPPTAVELSIESEIRLSRQRRRELHLQRMRRAWGGNMQEIANDPDYVSPLTSLFRPREEINNAPAQTSLLQDQPESAFVINNACHICFAAHIDSVLLPCSHLVSCSECAWRMLGQAVMIPSQSQLSDARSGCPVCRTKVSGIIKVFRA